MINRQINTKRSNIILVFLVAMVPLISCTKDEIDPVLTVSEKEISFPEEGGTAEITITCNDEWGINNSASSWLQLSQTSGSSGEATVQLTTESNSTGSTRSTILVVNSENGQVRRVKVSQASLYIIPPIYPSYNTAPQSPDETGMSSNAVELAAKMKLGWNIGNTLEAIGGENYWGNPDITKEYVEAVKNQGFNAIRLPCSWNKYSDQATAKINEAWMDRVKEVVQYCVDNDLYVLLNIHWDGGWLENNCTPEKKDSVNAKQKAFWEQIATEMRDFDEHLMFASANEPNVHDAEEMEVLHSYH